MDSATEFVNNFLSHYSSQYYDPVKAHEYYLKNRELQGRRSGSALKTESKKQAWSYARNEIKKAEKKEIDDGAAGKKQFIDHAQKRASERVKSLTEKLSLVFKGLSKEKREGSQAISEKRKAALADVAAKAADERKRIAERAQSKIDGLPPIPDGVSKERRAELSAKRKEEIAKIRGESASERSALNESVMKERKSISDDFEGQQKAFSEKNASIKEDEKTDVDQQREKVRTEVKAVVQKARDDYETFKTNVKAKYEQKSQAEYDSIKAKV